MISKCNFHVKHQQQTTQEDEDDDQVGSPSPPYEGVIIEEPEKQLESRGDSNGNPTTNDESDQIDEVRLT